MVIAPVYDRWGNHYCFPKGLFNQKKCRGGRPELNSPSWSPRKWNETEQIPTGWYGRPRGLPRGDMGLKHHDRQAGTDRSWAPSARQTLSSLTHTPAHAHLQPGGHKVPVWACLPSSPPALEGGR